jgi:hypothetical protein
MNFIVNKAIQTLFNQEGRIFSELDIPVTLGEKRHASFQAILNAKENIFKYSRAGQKVRPR